MDQSERSEVGEVGRLRFPRLRRFQLVAPAEFDKLQAQTNI